MKANLLSAGPTALALLLALGPGGPASAAAGSQHIYRVTLDSALTELAVEARLSGSVQSLQARNNRADRYLHNPRQCAGEQPLRVRRDAIALPEQADVCVRYEVDLAKLAEQRRYRRSSFQTPDRLASPTAWLWQPSM